MEDFLYRDKKIRDFLRPIREKEINHIVRELCLLGIKVFQERNNGIAHYSLINVKDCLREYINECQTAEYYKRFCSSTINDDHQDMHDLENSRAYPQDQFCEQIGSRHIKSQGNFCDRRMEDFRRSQHSRTHSQKSLRNNQGEIYSTQEGSQENDQEGIISGEGNFHQRSRSHSYGDKSRSPPMNDRRIPPDFHSLNADAGPDLSAVIDHRVRSNEKDRLAQIVTTLDRSMKYNHEMPYKRGATSPLKSCIQNAEVKVSRGGVAIAFDPWKQSRKRNSKRNLPQRNVDEEYFYDHICDDEEIRIADGHFFNSQAKSSGIQTRIDPQVEKLARRDMKLALKQRRKYEHKRRRVKESTKNKSDKFFKKKRNNKSPYKNVKSKIKLSVMKDKSRARERSGFKPMRRQTRSVTKSFTQREVERPVPYPPGFNQGNSFNDKYNIIKYLRTNY